ncbi:MAG: glycoside hydrolase family 88/105 protein, partial [Terriglobales bacterium]
VTSLTIRGDVGGQMGPSGAGLKRMLCALVMALVVAVPLHAQKERLDRLPVVGDQPDTALPIATDVSAAMKPEDVKNVMRKVADWQLNRLQGQYTNDWTMAVLYTGFMAASEATGDTKYRGAMKQMGWKLDWKLGPRFNHADDVAVGQTYLELYLADRAPMMIVDVREQLLRAMRVQTDAEHPVWWWCDALFMAPPAWARMYKVSGDRAFLDHMDRDWWLTSSKLYDPQEHLYSRDASFLDKHEANGKKLFWSRGNGWVMAGIVRVLQFMPKDYPTRAKYVTQLQEMASEVASLQGEDGLWRPGLLEEKAYPLPEVSGSAFFTYAIAWGVNQHILDAKMYRTVVEKAWRGLVGHIYQDGRLGCIQPVGAAPDSYKPTASYTYGVGAFLLAGSEVEKLARH